MASFSITFDNYYDWSLMYLFSSGGPESKVNRASKDSIERQLYLLKT